MRERERLVYFTLRLCLKLKTVVRRGNLQVVAPSISPASRELPGRLSMLANSVFSAVSIHSAQCINSYPVFCITLTLLTLKYLKYANSICNTNPKALFVRSYPEKLNKQIESNERIYWYIMLQSTKTERILMLLLKTAAGSLWQSTAGLHSQCIPSRALNDSIY